MGKRKVTGGAGLGGTAGSTTSGAVSPLVSSTATPPTMVFPGGSEMVPSTAAE